MLKRQSELTLSPYTALYDILIPKDNELRRLNEMIDFSFIYQELLDRYSMGEGRTAIDPVVMFKYLYLKVRYNLSDRDLIERTKTDMAFKFFLGLAPEAEVIHPTLLTKFRRQRLKDMDILQLLIGKTVEIAIAKGVLKSKGLIVDATHTVSRFNLKSPVESLRQASKVLRKHLYQAKLAIKDILPDKPTGSDLEEEQTYTKNLIDTVKLHPEVAVANGVPEALHSLEEVVDDIEAGVAQSNDKDAKVGHKSKDTSFLGYKTYIAMTTDRIITAAVITTGEKGDGRFLKDLIELSRANGVDPDSVRGDHAYSGKDNLKLAEKENWKLYSRLTPNISNGFRGPDAEWDYNKDAGMFICPAGHTAIRKARTGKKNQGRNQKQTYYFDIERCQKCPLREGCYKVGAKSKTYSVTLKANVHQKQLEFEQTDEFKNEVKLRYRIEAKNAELKIKHGYGKCWSNDIQAMTLQGAITLFYANMERILTQTAKK